MHDEVLDPEALFAAIEGERKCERCGGKGILPGLDNMAITLDPGPCPACNGDGAVREDRLVLLSDVLTKLRSLDVITVMRMLDELKPKDRPQ